jgi:osmotically-inducible protein OsmY
MSDAIITAKVKGKIRHLYINKKIVEGYNLHVETIDQVVHIFGNVARAMDVDTVVVAAKEIKGVKSVKTSIGYP